MNRLSMSLLLIGGAFAPALANAEVVPTGNGLLNHVTANLTWTADANLFVTQAASNPDLVTDIIRLRYETMPDPYRFAHPWEQNPLDATEFNTTTGYMTHHGAAAWINYLNLTNYKGYSDWRLPRIESTTRACYEYWCFPSQGNFLIDNGEWFRLYYQELGGVESVQLANVHNANFALLENFSAGTFWMRFNDGQIDAMAGTFGGLHFTNFEFFPGEQRVWPVRTGLSSATPPPMSHLALNKHALSFSGPVGTPGLAQEVVISSTGTGPASITTSVSDEFEVSNDCPVLLEPGSTCVAAVRYAPVTLGQRVGTLTISADGRSHLVSLSGSSRISLSLSASPATLTAGALTTLGWTALPASVTCTAIKGEAGDGWAGSVASSGTRSVTRPAPGTGTYALRCFEGNQTLDAEVTVTYTMPAVTLSGSTSVMRGEPHTLTWTSTNASSCTASGSGAPALWGGDKPTSGSATITETSLGLITYTLTCASGPQSAQSSVQVFVNAPPAPPGGGGGGGGSLGAGSLLALFALSALRVRIRLKE